LAKAIALLESLDIRFHLTGGITTVAYGEPRMTQDLDLVIDNDNVSARIEPFLRALSETDFLFHEASVREAIRDKRMFQLLDTREALKLDVYPRELIPGELDRSEPVEVFGGMTVPTASREDAAVSKLIWINKGSHKSRRDFRQVFRLANERQKERIRHLAQEMSLAALLDEVLAGRDEPIE
jgi:hypothetical protein